VSLFELGKRLQARRDELELSSGERSDDGPRP
jgi:hypothetical protein